jgi:hypothetical protein
MYLNVEKVLNSSLSTTLEALRQNVTPSLFVNALSALGRPWGLKMYMTATMYDCSLERVSLVGALDLQRWIILSMAVFSLNNMVWSSENPPFGQQP